MQPDIVTINRAVKTGYPLTSITWPYRGLKYRPIENFLSADNLLVFKWSQAQVHFFKCIRNELSRTIKILISIWPRTRKFSQLLRAKQGKAVAFDFSRHGHALVTLYVQFLCSDWSKFDRWVHAESLCSIWKLVYFDSWSWQSFVSSSCDVFNRLFPLDVQNEIQLPPRFLCYSWLVCLLGFWLRNAPLVQDWKSDFTWCRFRFSPCLIRKRVEKSQVMMAFSSCISTGKPE